LEHGELEHSELEHGELEHSELGTARWGGGSVVVGWVTALAVGLGELDVPFVVRAAIAPKEPHEK